MPPEGAVETGGEPGPTERIVAWRYPKRWLPFWTRATIWAAQHSDNYIDVSNEVLNDEVNISHCWPFWCSSGHVAIPLNQRVEVKRMRISHVQDDNSLSEALRRAPRDIALWSLCTDLNLTTFRPATDFTTAAGATDVPLFKLLGRHIQRGGFRPVV
ncbi:hypothetical protein BDN71DRAFT_1497941 [Pleurotus eryngii]|uniref:SUN domain-containing protein n=1 Tax=Pleurotus eryngii TaxID=5323 RepID=A0A9P5ZQ74_PLEER|nr:hypothetical protein BDN71DRAFT_1497941 [Pleurotus eryngii]